MSNISFLSSVKKGLWQCVKICIDNPSYYNLKEQDTNNNNALHILVQKSHPEFIKDLILVGLDPNAINKSGETPLLLAITNNCSKSVKILLANGAKVNQLNRNKQTPLFTATITGNIKLVQLLYEHGANINHSDTSGNTVLHEAARCNRPIMIAYYLRHKILVNKLNACQQTALHIAIEEGNSDIAIVLLGAGFGADTKPSILHLAVRMGDVKVTKVLLQSNSVKFLEEDEELRTPLHLATEYNHHEIAGLLLTKGADINAQDIDGYTAFHVAVQNGDLDMVQLFLEHAQMKNGDKDNVGKSYNVEILNHKLKTFQGDNVMHLLAASNLSDKLKMRMFYLLLTLDLRPLVIETNRDFRTALHFANWKFCRPLVVAFVNLGADVDEIDRFGKKAKDYCKDPYGTKGRVIKKENFSRRNVNVN